MTLQELIEILEDADSYSENCPGGKWETDMLREAVRKTLTFFDDDIVYRRLIGC